MLSSRLFWYTCLQFPKLLHAFDFLFVGSFSLWYLVFSSTISALCSHFCKRVHISSTDVYSLLFVVFMFLMPILLFFFFLLLFILFLAALCLCCCFLWLRKSPCLSYFFPFNIMNFSGRSKGKHMFSYHIYSKPKHFLEHLFWSSLRFTAKLGRKYRDFPYTPALTHAWPPPFSVSPPEWYTWWCTHYYCKSIVCIRVESWYCAFCGFKHM